MFGAALAVTPFGEDLEPSLATDPDIKILLDADEGRRRFFVQAFPVDSAGNPVQQDWSQGELFLTDPFKERLDKAIDFETSILSGRLALSGVERPDFGSIEVELDIQDDTTELPDLLWDGRDLNVFMGLDTWVQTRYLPALTLTIRDVNWDTSKLTLRLLDVGLSLKDPLQTDTYLGTGGIEGSENLTDATKPWCYGPNDNVTLRLVDAALDIYQGHDRSMQAYRDVFDGGKELTFDSDVADVVAWTPVPGSYVTNLSQGRVRLGAPPEKTVTANMDGDNDASLGGYVSSTADIIERILLQRAGYTASEIDEGAFSRMNIDLIGAKGVFSQNGSGSIESVITGLIRPLGFFRFNRLGKAVVGNFKVGGVDFAFDETNILSIESVDSPQAVHRVELGYHKSWTVMGDDALVGAATDDFREFVSEEFRVSQEEDAAIDTLRSDSVEFKVQTLLFFKADADAERARLLTLLKGDKRMWKIEAIHAQLEVVPGKTVSVKDAGSARTEMGLSCIVLSVAEDSETQVTTLFVWG